MKKHRRQSDLFVTTPEQRGPLFGLAVKLPDMCRCGNDVARVGAPVGPHLAELRCTMCPLHRGWLPRAAHRFLIEIVNRFGRPAEPIAIRRGGALRCRRRRNALLIRRYLLNLQQKDTDMKRNDVFPSKYLKAADLNGKPLVVEIDAAPLETLKSANGDEQKIVLYFVGVPKRLPLNMTNWDSVADIAGDDTEGWPGHRLELFPSETRMGGRPTACIRIRQPRAKAKTQQRTPAPASAPFTDDDESENPADFA
jgi:hypothetical protein